ncbi:MAG TPA: molybdopterin-dependent oxidoreductase [Polyangiaceae bacterium]|jgi:DMSO/TMAO reductase YedYZ molybdopterin-dependent catalytic subunit|nr:molybdopterin-dependent oxidoreductase [Polyangiaceae bacterium]
MSEEPFVTDIDTSEKPRMNDRRTFLKVLGAGTVITVLGGIYVVVGDEATRAARKQKLADGRPRLPPGQSVIQRLRPMGGQEGDPSPGAWKLKVHGACDNPFEIDFAGLLAMPQVNQTCDVHCVTKWSLLDSHWTGVRFTDIAAKAKPKSSAHYVVFEAAAGYTANVQLREAMRPNVIIAHKYEGGPLPRAHGAPVRAVVPDSYFWKSAKWLTGIQFRELDQPGYWETRGYNNHADPWKEERYS